MGIGEKGEKILGKPLAIYDTDNDDGVGRFRARPIQCSTPPFSHMSLRKIQYHGPYSLGERFKLNKRSAGVEM